MSLEYKALIDLVKPVIFVDAFVPKLGDPEDVAVVSFFVRDKEAAKDLMSWFEKGYDWVIDADMSPGELKPGRYLVYVELRRRSTLPFNVWQLLSDMNTLTEFQPDDWTMVYRRKEAPFDKEEFKERVPCSPAEYKEKFDKELNEVRIAAGLPIKSYVDRSDPDIRALLTAAGL